LIIAFNLVDKPIKCNNQDVTPIPIIEDIEYAEMGNDPVNRVHTSTIIRRK